MVNGCPKQGEELVTSSKLAKGRRKKRIQNLNLIHLVFSLSISWNLIRIT